MNTRLMILLLGVAIIVSFILINFKPNKMYQTLTETINTIFLNSYDELKRLNSEEVSTFDKNRIEKVRHNFDKKTLTNLINSLSKLTHINKIIKLKCNSTVESIETDFREKSDDEVVCYFTLHLHLDYTDESKTDETVLLVGICTMANQNSNWKIESIELLGKALELLLVI